MCSQEADANPGNNDAKTRLKAGFPADPSATVEIQPLMGHEPHAAHLRLRGHAANS